LENDEQGLNSFGV